MYKQPKLLPLSDTFPCKPAALTLRITESYLIGLAQDPNEFRHRLRGKSDSGPLSDDGRIGTPSAEIQWHEEMPYTSLVTQYVYNAAFADSVMRGLGYELLLAEAPSSSRVRVIRCVVR